MESTSKSAPLNDRDVFYYRQRQKNRVLEMLTTFFAEEAERTGITKKDLADKLKKDPAQVSRWFSGPTNLTLDTISDILLALEAEVDYRIIKFSEIAKPNEQHPLVDKIVNVNRRGEFSKADCQITNIPQIHTGTLTTEISPVRTITPREIISSSKCVT